MEVVPAGSTLVLHTETIVDTILSEFGAGSGDDVVALAARFM